MIAIIFRKELMELMRDRKTLVFMLALPLLLIPSLILGVGYFAGQAVEAAQQKELRYSIENGLAAPKLVEAIRGETGFRFIEVAPDSDWRALLQQNQLDFVLAIQGTESDTPLQQQQLELKLHYNNAGVNLVYQRVNPILQGLNRARQAQAFAALELSEEQGKALLQPYQLQRVNSADQREDWGSKIGGIIPYLLFILCLQGAIYPAADLAAGEKERGTLETLLVLPVSRLDLVLGKFLVILLAGLTSAVLTVGSFAFWGVVISQGLAVEVMVTFMAQIGVLDFLLLFLLLLPVVAIFASLLLSLSIYARSYKEAQSYMGALLFFVLLPSAMASMPGVELDGVWAWVPLTNVALAIKELLKGTIDYSVLLIIFASTLVIAGSLLWFCIQWFKRETVLFR